MILAILTFVIGFGIGVVIGYGFFADNQSQGYIPEYTGADPDPPRSE